VVMHQHELALPFRRYQMQPVWRADRPQKGRYREFWQCDADVVGSTSLINEAELLCIYQSAFHQLGLRQVAIKVNSRKLLAGLAEVCGAPEMMMEITIALDKLDKIGWDGVANELQQRGISEEGISSIRKVIEVSGTNEEKLASLEQIMAASETGMKGIEEIKQTLAYHKELADADWQAAIEVDISLARGLNYYTGVIVEVVCRAVKIGSIGGGGRYDDLTGLFGVKGLSGVGVSFGIDRTYDVMEELDLFPASVGGSKVMLTNFGGANETYALSVLKQLRAAGIAAEIYPDAAKFDKQMKYANKRGFAYVILAGDEEREKQMVSLKDFTSGAQTLLKIDQCLDILRLTNVTQP
jgi:histidyl-tRNA synthetase